VVMAALAGVSLAIDETAGTDVLRAAWRGHASCDCATTARSAWSGRRKACAVVDAISAPRSSSPRRSPPSGTARH
jgi:hypothetical protein